MVDFLGFQQAVSKTNRDVSIDPNFAIAVTGGDSLYPLPGVDSTERQIAIYAIDEEVNQNHRWDGQRQVWIVSHGAVTTGDRWKFLQIQEQTVTIALKEYFIPPVEEILGILVHFVSPGE